MHETGERRPLLILGLGNVLCGDDGLGVAAIAQLERRYEIPDGVQVLDGGTLGLALMHYVLQAESVILVDAIRADAAPGSLVRVEGEEVAPAVESRLSVHQIGVADLLDGLRWVGCGPLRLSLLGLVPRSLELALARSPEVERALPILVQAVVDEARRLGHDLHERDTDGTPLEDRLGVAPRALGL